MFLSFSKGTFGKALFPLHIEQMMSSLLFPFLLHPLLFSLQYNNSNYVQTTKHASSNDSTDMRKLAHLHNNKCRFEPIESLLTFKWYKDVIFKVCAYPGWLSVRMCREWSNSHVSTWRPRAPQSITDNPLWQCFVIGEKERWRGWEKRLEFEKKRVHRSGSCSGGGGGGGAQGAAWGDEMERWGKG